MNPSHLSRFRRFGGQLHERCGQRLSVLVQNRGIPDFVRRPFGILRIRGSPPSTGGSQRRVPRLVPRYAHLSNPHLDSAAQRLNGVLTLPSPASETALEGDQNDAGACAKSSSIVTTALPEERREEHLKLEVVDLIGVPDGI